MVDSQTVRWLKPVRNLELMNNMPFTVVRCILKVLGTLHIEDAIYHSPFTIFIYRLPFIVFGTTYRLPFTMYPYKLDA